MTFAEFNARYRRQMRRRMALVAAGLVALAAVAAALGWVLSVSREWRYPAAFAFGIVGSTLIRGVVELVVAWRDLRRRGRTL